MTARLSGRAGILALALAFAVLAGALWWFWLAPARDQVAQREAALEEITAESNAIQDTVGRLRAARPEAAARTAERLRLAKALPAGEQVPEALVQLEDLAARSGVELSTISAGGVASYGGLMGAEFELVVAGRFHDVDDFLYRLHTQVAVDDAQRPVVQGRLFALRTVSLAPAGAGAAGEEGAGALLQGTRVTANLGVIAYMAPADGAPDAGPPALPAPAGPAPAADPVAPVDPAPATGEPGIADAAPSPGSVG